MMGSTSACLVKSSPRMSGAETTAHAPKLQCSHSQQVATGCDSLSSVPSVASSANPANLGPCQVGHVTLQDTLRHDTEQTVGQENSNRVRTQSKPCQNTKANRKADCVTI